MASDGTTGQIPVASPVQGSQASSIKSQANSGKSLPRSGKVATSAGSTGTSAAAVSATHAVKTTGSSPLDSAAANAATGKDNTSTQSATDPQSLVSQLNKYLNNSGRPDQFRVDPANGNLIQQVNPSSGAVVGEYSAEEFPALARSVGASSLLIDSLA